MHSDFEARVARGLTRLVRFSTRRPLASALIVLLITGAALGQSVRKLHIEGSTEALFSPDLPFRQTEKRYYEAFPRLYESLFALIDGPTPEQAAAASSRLAARLEEFPDEIQEAFVPGGGAFFESHAFLYLPTEELEVLADRLAAAQPYLAELSRDGSLRGLASMLSRGLRAVREGDVPAGQLNTVLAGIDAALRADARGERRPLSWAEVLSGREIEAGSERRFLLIQPVLHHDDLQPARRAIARIRSTTQELGLVPEAGFRVRITGDAALSAEEMQIVEGQARNAGIASLVGVGLILAFALRSLRAVAATLTTLVVGLVLTAGFTALTVGRLNLMSVSFAVLFIGLGIDFGIHLCMRQRDFLRAGLDAPESLLAATRDIGTSILLCAATTAFGFLAFAPTDFVGIGELGIISGAGMFISFVCTLTLLPALLCLGGASKARSGASLRGDLLVGLTHFPSRYPRWILGAALLLAVGSILLLPRVRFDNNPLNVRDPGAESVRAFNDLLARGDGSSPWTLNAVMPDLASAEALAVRLRELDVVERVVTVSDFIPDEQSEKLAIIEDVSMFMPPLSGHEPSRPGAEETRAALQRVGYELENYRAEPSADPALHANVSRLEQSLGAYLAQLDTERDPDAALARIESSLLASLPAQLRLLQTALSAGRITLEKLPEALIERMVTEDGRVRVEIHPSGDLNDNAALASFVDEVRAIEPAVAGSAAEILESGRTVVKALQQALLLAVLVIVGLLLLLWRNLNDTVLVVLPLALAMLLTTGAAVLLGIPFNFADVIVLPLLLGMGVDSAIHMVHRAREVSASGGSLLDSSTAAAIGYSALTTIASFGTMAFATHQGLASLGQMLTLGMSCTLLCNLVILPALLQLNPPAVVKQALRAAAED